MTECKVQELMAWPVGPAPGDPASRTGHHRPFV